MKRWTNGLPGATKRLGAKMALRGLSASQPGCARIPMLARSTMLHLRGLIHCCSSHVRRSWIFILLRTAGPYILARLRRAATSAIWSPSGGISGRDPISENLGHSAVCCHWLKICLLSPKTTPERFPTSLPLGAGFAALSASRLGQETGVLFANCFESVWLP
jgi:hypothetical protein